MSYLVAWLVVAICSLGLAVLVYFPLRKRKLLASLIIALGCYWAMWPIMFDDEGHLAPLFVVLLFRAFLEPDGNPSSVLIIGFVGTLGILICYVALLLIRKATDGPRDSSSKRDKQFRLEGKEDLSKFRRKT
ncbi:MAG: hypothetical protein F4X44_01900 [Gammaproteobacteria bacterium]|nr:hypothetical protein [Gammaproteobacteria bacterium]MYD79351.1 hypothetical protein [Gammaproteobacteria bacterium]